MRKIFGAICAVSAVVLVWAVVIGLNSSPASAWEAPCDFLTGGGFIITTASGAHEEAKANFGVGGG